MSNITYSVNEIPIRLTDERWIHIVAATAVVNEIFGALPYIKKLGAKHVWFDFDDEADVLYVSLERPQRATDTDILEDGTFLRLREKKSWD